MSVCALKAGIRLIEGESFADDDRLSRLPLLFYIYFSSQY